jgi:hypothetical protein
VAEYNVTVKTYDVTLVVDDLTTGADRVFTRVRNESGSTITKGTPVAITGYNTLAMRPLVEPADITTPGFEPAVGIATADAADNSNFEALVVGRLSDLNTAGFTLADQLYLGAGVLTDTPPAGQRQALAVVARSHATAGVIDVALDWVNDFQVADADLDAIAALAGLGIAVRTAADTWALRSLAQPAAGITITNPAGTAGNPTFVLANDLAALEGLGATGLAVRSAADTWVQRSIVATSASVVVTDGDGVAANPSIEVAAATTALAGKVEIATQAEVDAGTDTTRVVTPETLEAAATVSHYTELEWGNASVAATTTTRYLTPSWDSGTAQISGAEVEFDIIGPGTLLYPRVRHNAPAGNGLDIVYTVQIDGASTALALTLASTGTDDDDQVTTVAVASGKHTVRIEVTKAASVGASPGDIKFMLGWRA